MTRDTYICGSSALRAAVPLVASGFCGLSFRDRGACVLQARWLVASYTQSGSSKRVLDRKPRASNF
ncbi:hypothetical protein DPMN_018793 [Dreissena polymorpha]|uniref:Uncharacterized protein n=1 Tax=Dreissena polymorpha TaxID=45954 RepID=A0A9D4FWQ8_DREPO|nr:hypothetical protein DPMN_134746 [Dreissena polymorpha]KAH3894636.1 hypothetical protein DPMN_018793 [Dreissena polymorpha]